MKAILLIASLFFVAAPALATETLTCTLSVERYVHQGENYLFDGQEVLKVSAAPVFGSSVALVQDEVYPVKYRVQFLKHDSISGVLLVDYDQPSVRDEQSVSAGADLILQARDYTSAGYDNYVLKCHAD